MSGSPNPSRADIPESKNDHLGLSDYISGLGNFIKTCQTPMTISIQGDWGAGKTSLFNLIKENHLKDNSNVQKVIEINTWQYSVIGYQDNLIPLLVTKIVNETGGEKSSRLKKKLPKIIRILSGALLKYVTGENLSSLESNEESLFKIETTLPDEIEAIKKDMQGLREGDKRIVVFIDDLDRLEPRVAVSLMEGIKNFLDCEGFVFILAIDEKVVFEGLKEKYGEQLAEARKHAFFDKLIQVPFTIPHTAYDIEEYIKSLGIDESQKAQRYADLTKELSPNANPRAIKRYLNLADLYKGFSQDGAQHSKAMLYAATIIQLEKPEVFDELASIDSEASSDYYPQSTLTQYGETIEKMVKGDEGEDFIFWIKELNRISPLSIDDFVARIKTLTSVYEFLEEEESRGIVTYKVGRKQALRINKNAAQVTITVYKDALSDGSKWDAVIESINGQKWRHKEGQNHATWIWESGYSKTVSNSFISHIRDRYLPQLGQA